jgi:hypothetical protein
MTKFNSPVERRGVFSDEYKYSLYMKWYNSGRPALPVFHDMIQPNDAGDKPTIHALREWVKVWREQATLLDLEVKAELEKRLVKEKVEMLYRHADLGQRMQKIGIEFLTDPDHEDEITSSTAVRLLVAGVEIERESRGLPETLEKIMQQTDDKLLERIIELSKDEPLEIEAITD